MKKEKIINIISLVINAFILVTTFIFVLQGVSKGAEDAQPGAETMTGLGFLKAFTNLSNILLAVCAFVLLVFNINNLFNNEHKIPKWVSVFYYIGAISTTVTFLTVVFFLGPLWAIKYGPKGYFYMFSGMMFFFHFLNPVLGIISFILFCKLEKPLSLFNNLIGLSSTFIYSIVYMGQVLSYKWIDFYGFTFGMKMYMVPISLIAMYLLTFGIGLALRKLNKKFAL